MKINKLKLATIALGLIAFVGNSSAQTATSNPVGYETLDLIAGFNYLGNRFVEKAEFTGTVSSISGTSITLSGTPALAGSGTYIVEITSGTADGAVTVASSVSGAVVVTVDDLSAEVASSDAVVIRPASTLSSVFGAANEIGLASTGSFGTSDQIWVPDGSGGFVKYAYLQGNPFLGSTTGWKDEGGSDVDSTVIDLIYTDGIIISSPSANQIVTAGGVKLTRTSTALTQNFNYIGSVYPVGATLSGTFGAANESGLTTTGSFGTSDQVWLPDGSGGFVKYAYVQGNPFLGSSTGWKDEAGADVDAATVILTSGAVIQKNGADKNIVLAQPTSYSAL